ncbi:MAG: hypothetical protein HKN26_07745 [Acidimicrobiales bacterium]|nr:hypothetical protein [Acidimicrobiales bacterium]
MSLANATTSPGDAEPEPGEPATTADEASLPLGVLILVGALFFGVFRQGAYHAWQLEIFSYAAFGAGALLLLSQRRMTLVSAAVITAPLFASAALSTALSSDTSDARSTFLVIGLVAIGLAAGFAVPPQRRPLAIDAVVLVALVVAATAIWGVAHHQPKWGRITEGVWRGSSSLTYANAAASLLGPIVLLLLRRLVDRPSIVLTMAATFCTIGFASTQSRGGALAVVAVGIVLLLRTGFGAIARVGLPIAAGTAVGAPALLAFAPTTEQARPFLVLTLVATGLAISAGLALNADRIPRPGRILAGLAVIAIVVAATTGLAEPLTDRLTLRSSTTAGGPTEQVRFGDRGREWKAGWDQFVAAPVAGNGPGVVNLRWTQDGRSYRANFVHNEYLEFAVTNGALGLAALLASASLFAWRTRRVTGHVVSGSRSGPPDRWVAGAVAFAVGAFALHSAFDFLWHLPALPVLFAFLAGVATSRPT